MLRTFARGLTFEDCLHHQDILAKLVEWRRLSRFPAKIGTLRNHDGDGDGNGNVKKQKV